MNVRGYFLGQRLRPSFVRAICIRVDKADGDGLHPFAEQALRRSPNRHHIERRDLDSLRVHPAGHLQTQMPWHQRLGLFPVNVIELVQPHAADF